MNATREGHIECVRLLLEAGADTEATSQVRCDHRFEVLSRVLKTCDVNYYSRLKLMFGHALLW